MIEDIKTELNQIERNLSESDNSHDKQCNDMTLNFLKIAHEWQKLRIKKPPDCSCRGNCSCSAACGGKDA